MENQPTRPRTPDSEVAARIALVREATEAAAAGAIHWQARDRRLRNLFRVRDTSRAFDRRHPS